VECLIAGDGGVGVKAQSMGEVRFVAKLFGVYA
jgi:hypothetical protein